MVNTKTNPKSQKGTPKGESMSAYLAGIAGGSPVPIEADALVVSG
jgi:hypothetical protein